MFYEVVKPSETITADRYLQQMIKLDRRVKDKRPQYDRRNDKVILQHNNVHGPCCKTSSRNLTSTQMGNLTPPAIFARHFSIQLPHVSKKSA